MGPTHAVPPPGLERAPPRLIPGEDDRCFLLLAVASPLIPEGGCATTAAPLLSRPCPEGPDRPRYMVAPLCAAYCEKHHIVKVLLVLWFGQSWIRVVAYCPE